MNYCIKVIENCIDCEHCKVDKVYTPDSYDHESKATCTKENKVIAEFDDNAFRKCCAIPDWCPNKSNCPDDMNSFLYIKEVLMRRYPGYAKVINEVFTKAIALDQITWERNIAISQLNEIGLEFGEKTDRIKELIEDGKRLDDDLK